MSSKLQSRVNLAWESVKKNDINPDELIKLLDECLIQQGNKHISHHILNIAHEKKHCKNYHKK